MEYRALGKTGLSVSAVGMGCEGFLGRPHGEVVAELRKLLDAGVNFLDVYTSDPAFHAAIGEAIRGREKDLILEIHLGAVWQNNEYLRTRDMDLIRADFEQRMELLGLDSVEIGMIHFSDEKADWERIMSGGLLDFAKELKAAGRIRHIGLSTHSTDAAMEAAKSGEIEVMLFSVNPCYDMRPGNEGIFTLYDRMEQGAEGFSRQDGERRAFYEYCERSGIGLTVMKPFAGGSILNAKTSPFGAALTPVQCIHYALTRPAVATVCCGCRSWEQWEAALAYDGATDEEKDFTDVLAGAGACTVDGHCMYCGHCAPCTVGIKIADVTKYLDLAVAEVFVPETVRDHYRLLPHAASECIECGACEERCPFHVSIIENMRKAAELLEV